MSKFKVGDKIIINHTCREIHLRGKEGIIIDIVSDEILVSFLDGTSKWSLCESSCSLPRSPHKHHVEIKAWADGAKIQARIGGEFNWRDTDNPRWLDEYEYRVAPEIKEDIIKYVGVNEKHMILTGMFDKLETLTSYGWENPVQFIFDGETKKLKDVKII